MKTFKGKDMDNFFKENCNYWKDLVSFWQKEIVTHIAAPFIFKYCCVKNMSKVVTALILDLIWKCMDAIERAHYTEQLQQF